MRWPLAGPASVRGFDPSQLESLQGRGRTENCLERSVFGSGRPWEVLERPTAIKKKTKHQSKAIIYSYAIGEVLYGRPPMSFSRRGEHGL